MKKLRYMFVLIFFYMIVPLSAYIYMELTPDFPHYKQVFYRNNGSVTAHKGSPVFFTFIAVDEKENSEMERKDKILSFSIYDSDGNEHSINNWSTYSFFRCDSYVLRQFSGNISFPTEGLKEFKTIKLRYLDDIKEYYEIGSFKINIVTNAEENGAYADVSSNSFMINTVESSNYPFSGIYAELDFRTYNEITINDIELGIEGFEPDFENIITEYTSYSLTDLEQLRASVSGDAERFRIFNNLRIDSSYRKRTKPIILKNQYPSDQEIKKAAIFIPIICTDAKYLETINTFNITLHALIDGEEKLIKVGDIFSLTAIPEDGKNIFPMELLDPEKLF